MAETCSRCGSSKDVELTGEVYMCSSCRGEDAKVDPRLKFAKWAVEHGRITDFPGKVDELYENSARTEHV